MLTTIEVENFQSLRKLSVKLGKFTVVTGATGSGKSALIRAVKLLVFNARGTDYVTRGAKYCQVGTGDQEQGWFAAITRGVARGKDAYRLSFLPQSGDEPHVETYTKLGGEVPADITSALQLTELNFADQRDVGRPFLLDSSGGEVARVLGKLTNVTLLFDAAREASRRRLEIMGDLKRAEANLAALTEAAQRFRGMRERHAAVSEAETAMDRAGGIERQISRLSVLMARQESAQQALARAQGALPDVPSVARLDDLAARLDRLRSLRAALDGNLATARDAKAKASHAAGDLIALHQQLHEVLVAAGQCPVCGQAVSAA